jgi:diguanylate cyclase (GGDEF)-like protein
MDCYSGRSPYVRAISSEPGGAETTPHSSWRRAALLVAEFTLLFVVWIEFQLGGERATQTFSNLATTGAALWGAGACAVGARRSEGRVRRGWLLLGASALAWGLGNAVWSWYEIGVGREVPFPSLADAGYLFAVPLAAVALLSFPGAPSTLASRLRTVLDAAIVGSALLFVSWAFLLGPLYRDSSGSALEQAIGLAYPVGDLVTATLVLLVLVRTAGTTRLPLVFVGAGLMALVVADSGFAYLTLNDSYTTGTFLDGGWALAFLLIGLGALHPSAPRLSVPEDEGRDRLSSLSLLLPYVAVVSAILVAGYKQVSDGSIGTFLFWNAITCTSMVVVRQLLTLLENVRLTRTLEAQVVARTAELRHQAFHDPLTNLANRALFRDRVAHSLERSTRALDSIAVLLLDLDGFKAVNDSYGHAAGDRLLVLVADRLRACVRPSETVARLGGDEFAVLVEDVEDPSEPARVAERVLGALRDAFPVEGRELFIHASVGIAVSAFGTVSADDLLRDADLAMYMAKNRGRNRYELFEPSMHGAAVRRLELEADLRRAVQRDEFVVHYQPIVGLDRPGVARVEALVRWDHPERGMVPPADFIGVAEETGLVIPLGWSVLAEACREAATWPPRWGGGAPVGVTVNLSGRQLLDAALPEGVGALLRQSGLPPERLTLEITESVLLEDAEGTIARLHQLKELGVLLAIDDFGTGYSSLSYLARFPVDILKIDRSFVAGIARGAEESALARAIVKLGRTFRLQTVAEGVEDVAQAERLAAMGCDQAQGFHFARPMTAVELRTWLADRWRDRRPAIASDTSQVSR